MSVVADAASGAALRDATGDGLVLKRTARFVTWALVLLVVWLPLQTPIAIAIFQYGHSVGLSQATLLLKDVVVALLALYALAVTWRSLKLRWFDWLAIAYVVLVGIYSTVPWLLGSKSVVHRCGFLGPRVRATGRGLCPGATGLPGRRRHEADLQVVRGGLGCNRGRRSS